VAVLALLRELGETGWLPLLSELERSGVPAPLPDDVLRDLTIQGRTIGVSALAIWRRGAATLALNGGGNDLQADSTLLHVAADSDAATVKRAITDFLGG
jgi:hypothetical protein